MIDFVMKNTNRKKKDRDSGAVRNNVCNIFVTIICTLGYLPRNFESKFMSMCVQDIK